MALGLLNVRRQKQTHGELKVKFRTSALALAASVLFSMQASAEVKPISNIESAKLTQFREHPKLIDCIAVYYFDFFANQFGFSVDGEDPGEAVALEQLRAFLKTGKLEPRTKLKTSKDLERHCLSVAQTAVEVLMLKRASGAGQVSEEN